MVFGNVQVLPGADIDTESSSIEIVAEEIGNLVPVQKPTSVKSTGDISPKPKAPLKNYLNVSANHMDSENVRFILF